MITPSTNRDIQRITFVESLHASLKKQATKAIKDHQRFIAIANSYITDGLEESECIELLMIDGVSREASEGYIAIASNKKNSPENKLPEYSFQFEDVYGKMWTSFDIGKTVRASTDNDAWTKAEEIIDRVPQMEPNKVLSVNRIS